MALGFSQFKRPLVNIQNIVLKKVFFFSQPVFQGIKEFAIFLHTITRSLMAFNWVKLTKGMPICGVCVFALSLSLSLSFTRLFTGQHTPVFLYLLKKSNTVGKGGQN